jgi:hypothetical protein
MYLVLNGNDRNLLRKKSISLISAVFTTILFAIQYTKKITIPFCLKYFELGKILLSLNQQSYKFA